jgi:NDP-sugar pyrophosphorylase family protein
LHKIRAKQLMKAVILAAGVGKRMLPLTQDIPKPLLRVGNQPILDYIFDNLTSEIDTVIMVVGYLENKIRTYLGSKYQGKNIRYVRQEELTGTATALFTARDLFQKDERFIIIYGDELPVPGEIEGCLKHNYSWLCCKSSNPKQSGIADIDGFGKIIKVIEKPENPPSDMSAAGIMVVNSSIFDYTPVQHENGEYYITSLMNDFMKENEVYAVYGRQRPPFLSPDEINKIDPAKLIIV